jgi:flagellar assembly factor FliW
MPTLDKEPALQMKTISTKAFGTIEIEPESIYSFPDGLYGFAEETEFALLSGKADSPFLWLQSTKDEHLAFILIDPHSLVSDYIPKPLKSDLDALEVESVKECRIFTIVTIPQNAPEEMTVNLQGPVLLNDRNRKGRQVISDDDRHGVRMPVLKLMEAGRVGSGA